jgi:hypothetical protein
VEVTSPIYFFFGVRDQVLHSYGTNILNIGFLTNILIFIFLDRRNGNKLLETEKCLFTVDPRILISSWLRLVKIWNRTQYNTTLATSEILQCSVHICDKGLYGTVSS